MRKEDSSRGAVSIFLVIILVPMLVVSSLFVDASRVKLARGVAQSAGDLVLNTALTNYDTQLKDLYGLFATSQDTEELFERLEDYYRSSIISAGVNEQDTEDIISNIMNSLGSVAKTGDVSDLLNMEIIDFGVEKNSELTLANASVIKKQVIDFMKYRAPINTGLSFITSLKSFTTLSKQTELVQRRQEYYETEEDLMTLAKKAWEKINEYNKSEIVTNKKYLEDLKKLLNEENTNSIKSVFEESAKTIVKDLYKDKKWVSLYKYKIETKWVDEDTIYILQDSITNKKLKNVTEYNEFSDEKKCTKDIIVEALKDYSKTLTEYKNKKNNYDDVVGKYIDSAKYYDIQVVRQVLYGKNGSVVTNDFINSMIKKGGLYDKYTYLLYCMKNLDDETKKSTIEWGENKEEKTIGDIYNEFKVDFPNVAEKDLYHQFVTTVNSYYDFFVSKGNKGTIDSRTDSTNVNNKLNETVSKISKYKETLQDAVNNLDGAIKKLEAVKSQLGVLKEKKDRWNTAATDKEVKNTNLAKQDKAEINTLDKNYNETDIQKLITRLTNIKNCLGNVISEIGNYKYMDKSITSLDSFNNLVLALESHPNIGVNNLKAETLMEKAVLETKAVEYSANKFQSGNIDISWISDKSKNPILHGTNVEILNFYAYLYTKFNEGSVSTNTKMKKENTDSGQDVFEQIKKLDDVSDNMGDPEKMKGELPKSANGSNSSTSTDTAANTNNEIKNIKNKPSSSAGSGTYASIELGDNVVKGTSEGLATMFSKLGDAIKNAGTDLRDNLLFADYVMSMFSYDTIKKELDVTKQNSNIPVKDRKETPQTSTLTPIDNKHNFAYRREVEYVIYGGSNASNVTKAYTSIYGIRLAFNLIYAFSSSEIRDTAFAIATPASAATMGVVPVQLIQAAIIVGVACVESGLDVVALSNGKEVALMKNKDTWQTSMSGILNNAKVVASEMVTNVANTLVDAGASKLNHLLDLTDEQINEWLADSKKLSVEISTAIQSTVRDIINNCANTVVQQVTNFVNVSIEYEKYTSYGEVKIENITNKVLAELKQWSEEDSGVFVVMGHNLKKLAIEAITKDSINDLVSAVLESEKTPNEKTIDRYVARLVSMINQNVGNVVNNVSSNLSNQTTELIKTSKEKVNGKAKELKDGLSKMIDDNLGKIDSDSNTTMSTLMAFSYSDYLRLFLMIGLCTNEDSILLRCADAIQSNMVLQTGEKDYKLSQSSVYVDLNTTVQVKPIMLALPLFVDVKGNPAYKQGWYTFNEKITKGY